jgi:hypothetical protein
MQTELKVSVVAMLASLASVLARSQDHVYSEVPFIVEDGTLKCARVIVAFNRNVLPTERGTVDVDLMRHPIQDRDTTPR